MVTVDTRLPWFCEMNPNPEENTCQAPSSLGKSQRVLAEYSLQSCNGYVRIGQRGGVPGNVDLFAGIFSRVANQCGYQSVPQLLRELWAPGSLVRIVLEAP